MSTPQRRWLEDLLRCPECRGRLALDAERGACDRGHAFPIVGGIPRFTPRATYADSFGFQWTRFPTQQLDSGSRRESEEAFAEKTGLTPEDVRGATVLDAGCGMGRFTDVVARWGAARVVGVDLSRAVEAAGANLAGRENAAVLQADLQRPPLAEGAFDIVFSIGVLHHTPRTAVAFRNLARFVKPGGVYCIWVYARRLQFLLAGGELLRPLTRRMPEERLLRTIRAVVPRVDALRERLPSRAGTALDMVLPVSRHPDPEWRILDTFDWYSPRYQWKHTYGEVEAWFERLGFEDVARLPVPVAVRGRRPLAD